MARIRTIKPEAHLDEELWDLEEETGIPLFRAFTGLWCQADREGRFEWRPRVLRAAVLPYWDGNFGDVLETLVRGGFVLSYEVEGRRYGHIRNFRKHQLVNVREAKSKLPPPPHETHVHACAPADGINVPPKLRAQVLERDQYRCLRCGSTDDLTMDHILPRSSGGTHVVGNLRTLCRSCNSARPVQGKALEEDLARDGHTISSLQRTCMHVQECDPPSLSLPSPVPVPVPDPGGAGGESNGSFPPTDWSDVETPCPLDLEHRAASAGVLRELSDKLGAPLASVVDGTREFVGYWTIGEGAGQRRRHWMRKLREHIRRAHRENRLRPPGAIEHEPSRGGADPEIEALKAKVAALPAR